jgi:hypothetical protein
MIEHVAPPDCDVGVLSTRRRCTFPPAMSPSEVTPLPISCRADNDIACRVHGTRKVARLRLNRVFSFW